MLGEALEGAAEEKQEELSKKSHIPLPPATNILQRMGFPIGYVNTFVRKCLKVDACSVPINVTVKSSQLYLDTVAPSAIGWY